MCCYSIFFVKFYFIYFPFLPCSDLQGSPGDSDRVSPGADPGGVPEVHRCCGSDVHVWSDHVPHQPGVVQEVEA